MEIFPSTPFSISEAEFVPQWHFIFCTEQGVFSLENPRAGAKGFEPSTPRKTSGRSTVELRAGGKPRKGAGKTPLPPVPG